MHVECKDVASFLAKWNKPGLTPEEEFQTFFLILELIGFNYLVYLQLNLNR